MKLFVIVICFLCVNFLMASETYKAGVVNLQNKEISEYTPYIYEAGKTGVDILVLPSLKPSGVADNSDNYDESVKLISKAAKQSRLYVVAHLYVKTHCEMGDELVRSNLVFDRKGAIIAEKPINGVGNCTASNSELVTFATDFGVTFGVLMEEDIVLYDGENMKGVNNFVLTGDWQSEVAFLDAAYFAPAWSYITNANLVSATGIYSGKAGLKTGSDNLAVADLRKNGRNEYSAAVPISLTFPVEDLSQYVIKPLDLAAASKGYKETVCHRSFCCEFYIKADTKGTKPDARYSLSAFNGVRPFSAQHNIGAHICAMYSGEAGSENSNSKLFFERIHITANFTKQNAQYPIVQSTAVLPAENFRFDTKSDGISQQLTLEVVDTENVVNFGIFGKEFVKENFVFNEKNSTESEQNEIFDLIFNEDVQEIFDYFWIRLRVLIVVVSIYILEML